MKSHCKKIYIAVFLFLTFYTSCKDIPAVESYEKIISPYASNWHENCVTKLSTEDMITITDALILSYQIVHASIIMSESKLAMQAEIFKLITLSINDGLDATVQAQNNDLSIMKDEIDQFETAQEQIKKACNILKTFGPLIIKISPEVTKQFIANLKKAILAWASEQTDTIESFEDVKQEFITTAQLFSNIKNIFDEISEHSTSGRNVLLEGANSITEMYKNIEKTFAKLTETRLTGTKKLNNLFIVFFKMHYEILFDILHTQDDINIHLKSTKDHTLPTPQSLFV